MQDPVSRKLSTRSVLPALAAAVALVAAQGCVGEQLKSLSDLNALRQALVREYRHQQVEVKLHEVNDGQRVLSAVFFNSAFNRLADAERARKAQEIAAFARGRYAGAAGVSHITVTFVRSRARLVFFQSHEVVGYYPFAKNQILESEVAAAAAAASARDDEGGGVPKARASYSPFNGETTVSVNYLQIYGDLNDGLILLPGFAVRGERVAAPRHVDFEFVSYSKRRIFDDDDRLSVVADGRELLSRAPQMTSHGRGQDGTYAEVVKHRLSYREFTRLAGARAAVFTLGPKEFDLSPEHLAALRGMKECVDAGECP